MNPRLARADRSAISTNWRQRRWLIPIAAEWVTGWPQPDVYSLEWRLRQRYERAIRRQMETFVQKESALPRDLSELLKALSSPEIFDGHTRVSDREFYSLHQRMRTTRRWFVYRFADVMQVVLAIGLFGETSHLERSTFLEPALQFIRRQADPVLACYFESWTRRSSMFAEFESDWRLEVEVIRESSL